jgi:hypothetical protein
VVFKSVRYRDVHDAARTQAQIGRELQLRGAEIQVPQAARSDSKNQCHHPQQAKGTLAQGLAQGVDGD